MQGRRALIGKPCPEEFKDPDVKGQTYAARIIQLVRGGNYAIDAANASGICIASFYAWKKRGEDAAQLRASGKAVPVSERVYLDFLESVERAGGSAKADMVETIRLAAKPYTDKEGNRVAGNWVAAMTFLERRDPDNWGRGAQRVQLENPDGSPLFDLSNVSDKDLRRMSSILGTAKGKGDG